MQKKLLLIHFLVNILYHFKSGSTLKNIHKYTMLFNSLQQGKNNHTGYLINIDTHQMDNKVTLYQFKKLAKILLYVITEHR